LIEFLSDGFEALEEVAVVEVEVAELVVPGLFGFGGIVESFAFLSGVDGVAEVVDGFSWVIRQR
jgi:hypothetical protein